MAQYLPYVPATTTTTTTFRDYEDEEWRTVYIGFVERGTSEQELLHHFKVREAVKKFFLSCPGR